MFAFYDIIHFILELGGATWLMPFCPFPYNFRNGLFGIGKDRQKLAIFGKKWQKLFTLPRILKMDKLAFAKIDKKLAKIGKDWQTFF